MTRDIRGDRNPRSKLTVGMVVDARRRCAKGESISSIAQDMPVAHSVLCRAIRGVSWSHVPEPCTEYLQGGERHPNAKLTRDQVDAMRAEWRAANGVLNITAMARRYGINRRTARAVVHGRSWKE